MKRIYFILAMLLLSLFATGQQSFLSHSYQVERVYLDTTNCHYIDNIEYADGFGHKLQKNQVRCSPDGVSDLIWAYEYDLYGMLKNEFLPYPKSGNQGAFDVDAFNALDRTIYGKGDKDYAFMHTEYENSSLNRIVKTIGPGMAWHTNNKNVAIEYGWNTNDEVRLYRVSFGGELSVDGYFKSGLLQKVTQTGEDGCINILYTDDVGNEILNVKQNENLRLETYKVYDSRNRLRWILPPETNSILLNRPIDDVETLRLAYYYEYDGLGRMVIKQLPGADPIYMVYDKHDRLVLVQDGRQRAMNEAKWSYLLYDIQNRMVENGELTLSPLLSHIQLRQFYAEDTNYTAQGVRDPLQYIVYDNYRLTNTVVAYPFTAVSGYADSFYPYVTGLVTGMKAKIIGTEQWITTTIYYDNKCREIQTVSSFENAEDMVRLCSCSLYDFVDNAVANKIEFARNGSVGTFDIQYRYDDWGRLLSRMDIWNNEYSDSTYYAYDALGRITEKRYGDHILEKLSCNIRGWLTSIDSPFFSQTLYYTDGVGTPCYNGNISSTIWKMGIGSPLCGYKFTYDGVNRLKNAIYGEGKTLSENVNRFSEQVTGYDKQGNITGLLRYGQISLNGYGVIDNLCLRYDGNHLKSVSDEATVAPYGNSMEFKDGANEKIEYEYDENGNLVKDLNKKITDIQYNCLNLPTRIKFENGNCISYLYASDGTKIRSTYIKGNDTLSTFYLGNAIFENDVLVKVLTGDGFITVEDNNFHYFMQDHQGNVRSVVQPHGIVDETNDYYPLGGIFSLSQSVQTYKYNRKELDRKNGLDWYDYGARYYDAMLGRWHVMDPMSEKYVPFSPYSYCGNNPVNFVDPDGMDWYQDSYGNTFWHFGTDPISGYTNIGSTFSSPIFGGGFLNYYQNTIISTSNLPGDAFNTILFNLRLQNSLLKRGGSLGVDEQSRLFNALNSRSIDNWLRPLEEEAVKFAATSFVGAGVGKGAGWAFEKIGSVNFNGWQTLINQVKTGGKSFEQYKKIRGGTKTLGYIKTSTGSQRISTEFHHMFIPQRVQKAYNLPNWLINNRINVWKINTIQHSLLDTYRFRFLRAGIKSDIGWIEAKYNWFTNL